MGFVQGVGFRPFVYNQALIHNVLGWVNNDGGNVILDIEGNKINIKEFLLKIIKLPPPQAQIKKVSIKPLPLKVFTCFEIKKSICTQNTAFIQNDLAICQECSDEIFNPHNRRYQYPFTNCTQCGPRYTILKKYPYDRENTTMSDFKMCELCKKEYDDPSNRRFHAQTNCCPVCGPQISLLNNDGMEIKCEDIIMETIKIIKSGKIVAIKGLGGFHLTCDPYNEETVELLRTRKHRPHKPFAIMAKNIAATNQICFLNKDEEKILKSSKAPIILAKNKQELPKNIAPNLNKIGVMLPYTPLHYLLFQEGINFLVMTSGNITGGVIEYKNEKAVVNLNQIADYFLIHNREIEMPAEDSVVKMVGSGESVVRMGRGYSPCAIPFESEEILLAIGGLQKNAFAISKNGNSHLSMFNGDISGYDAYKRQQECIQNMKNLLNVSKEKTVYDLSYSHTHTNKSTNDLYVQHHHAHMVSCMVEHKINEPVIGVIFDGTGFGEDDIIWGGEIFIGDRKSFKKVGGLTPIKIQGGEQAIKEPWRIAMSYLCELAIWDKSLINVEEYKKELLIQAWNQNINCFYTSSMGRFFDCVASLINLRNIITYDGQAAIELESISNPEIKIRYSYNIAYSNDLCLLDHHSIISSIIEDLYLKIPIEDISAKFHNTMGIATVDMIRKISETSGIRKIILSGGVFENLRLLTDIIERLKVINFEVYFNQEIPINDNGIAVGQLAIAAENLTRG